MNTPTTAVLTPTASTGATAVPVAPLVTLTEDRLFNLARMREVCEPLGVAAGALADQLSAFIAHERCGVHLYRSVAGRTGLDDLRATYEQFGEETLRHVEIYTELITSFGGDPQYVSAAARAVEKTAGALLQATFLVSGSSDAMTRELVMLDAVALAEAKCHANWELLAKLAATLPDGPARDMLDRAVDEVQVQEEEHLGWAESMREQMVAELLLPGTELVDDELDFADEDSADEDAADVDGEVYAGEAYTDELASMTRDELYARAQELGIPGRSAMTKDELIEALGREGQG